VEITGHLSDGGLWILEITAHIPLEGCDYSVNCTCLRWRAVNCGVNWISLIWRSVTCRDQSLLSFLYLLRKVSWISASTWSSQSATLVQGLIEFQTHILKLIEIGTAYQCTGFEMTPSEMSSGTNDIRLWVCVCIYIYIYIYIYL